MRKNFGAKPWTYPQPVFIIAAYDEDGVPNAMNAACVSLIRLVMRESPRRLPRGLHLSCRSHGI